MTLKSLATCVYLQMAIGSFIFMAFAPATHAGLTGPYAVDGNTLHLWHLQETSGPFCFDSVSNQNPQTFNFDLTNTPGPNALPEFAGIYPTTNFTLLAQPGPDSTLANSTFAFTNAITTAKYSCLYEPWQYFAPTNYNQYPLNLACTNIANFVNTNTGAWTMECLIQPQVNLATFSAEANQSLNGGDGPGNYLLPARGWQWRLNYNGGRPQLEFNDIMCPGTNHDLFAFLPTAGPDAIASAPPWPWYHVAVAYSGSAPTNGDTANVFTMYWTLLDPTRTSGGADILTNFHNAFTFTNKSAAGMLPPWSPNTLGTGLYPSNSLHGIPFLTVGANGRANATNNVAGGSGFLGSMAEARMSMSYRHTNEFVFNAAPVVSAPIILGAPSTNQQFVPYGGTFTVQPLEIATPPVTNQWSLIVNGVTNLLATQTNSLLVVSNVTFAADGFYQLTVKNAYGTSNSALAWITVNPAVEGLFNTGCGPQNNPLNQSAPGSVDQHWQLPVDPDASGTIPNAIVWSDLAPVQPNGLVPQNGASVWIGPRQNASNKTGGGYSYQTTFQADEVVVNTNTVISGNVLAANGNNSGTMQVFLNGVETDFKMAANTTTTPTPFSITNGLQPGSNTVAYTIQYQSGNGYAGVTAFNCLISSATGAPLTNAPVITNAPVGVTNLYGSTVSFSAVALGAPPLFYQWLSNSVPVTPSTWIGTALPYLSFVATNFSTSQLVGTNYFANIQIVFSNSVGVVTSAVATLNIQIPPLALASAGVPIWDATTNETNIVVFFSGTVDPATATTAGNYSLNNGASVLSAALGGASNEVVLTTSVLNPATSYTLTVQNVNSSFGFVMNPSPASVTVGTYPTTVALWVKSSVGVTADGSGNVSQWNDLSGNGNNLTDEGFGPPYDPILATNASGYPVIRFVGTNGSAFNFLEAADSPSLEITSNMTIFAVVNFATLIGGTNGEIVSKVNVNNQNQPNPYDYYANANAGAVILYRGNGSTPANVNSSTLPTTGLTHLLDVVMQGTNVTHRLDGKSNGGGNMTPIAITDGGQPLFIGTRQDSRNRLTGDLSELILVGSALSSSDTASMENYLTTEYNIVAINPLSTNIAFSFGNNQLTLSWPADHTGWILQTQTNDLSVGIGTNWSNVAGSTLTNQVVIPINLTNGSVFYRLVYP